MVQLCMLLFRSLIFFAVMSYLWQSFIHSAVRRQYYTYAALICRSLLFSWLITQRYLINIQLCTGRTTEGCGQLRGKQGGKHPRLHDTRQQPTAKHQWHSTLPEDSHHEPLTEITKEAEASVRSWLRETFLTDAEENHHCHLERSLPKRSAYARSLAIGFKPNQQSLRTPWM